MKETLQVDRYLQCRGIVADQWLVCLAASLRNDNGRPSRTGAKFVIIEAGAGVCAMQVGADIPVLNAIAY